MNLFSEWIVSVASTLTAAGVVTVAGYVRSIVRRVDEVKDRTQLVELYTLDHENRIKHLEKKGSP